MRDKSRIQDRRNFDRVKMNYPATYTRYDKWGNPCDQKIAKVADVNLQDSPRSTIMNWVFQLTTSRMTREPP
jgi:hypothetical protein